MQIDHYSKAQSTWQRNKFLREASKTLKDIDFDGFVVTGRSGLLVGAPLASRMRKHLLVPRRPHEFSHATYKDAIGVCGSKLVFLDDFMSSGRTLRRVLRAVKDLNDSYDHVQPEWVGVYLYSAIKRWRPFGPDGCPTVNDNMLQAFEKSTRAADEKHDRRLLLEAAQNIISTLGSKS